MGADIVVTGRTADSALALAPCMHELGWDPGDLDLLASGSLAGHLIECGGQATGGLFTDWEEVPGYENLGFPVAEVDRGGAITVTKPPGTGGILTRLAVAEHLLCHRQPGKDPSRARRLGDCDGPAPIHLRHREAQVLVPGYFLPVCE